MKVFTYKPTLVAEDLFCSLYEFKDKCKQTKNKKKITECLCKHVRTNTSTAD